MKPKLKWIFEAISAPLCFTSNPSLMAEPDADQDDLVSELADAGYYAIRFILKEWVSHVWPGGYPVFYITKDNGLLCARCANENLKLTCGDDPQWEIVESDVNYEDECYCDHCGDSIEAAYL